MKNLLIELRISLIATASLAVLLCGIYPLLVWLLGQGIFPAKANGSLVMREGKIAGSSLISQGFASPKYFHPRPSSAGQGHDPANSGGSNLGPTSQKFIDATKQRVVDYRSENSLGPDSLIPADAVTASASGLDPHVSVENALLQATRIAKTRGLSTNSVLKEIEKHTEGRDLGILGESRVNVLMLNMGLDGTLK
ncbi:MAG: K(+)-transporting ATPase subunit C [Proteobacteria bacterium]|nr:K(+)-transporting ATPase subunit C [Pseudomonadota bacterium]